MGIHLNHRKLHGIILCASISILLWYAIFQYTFAYIIHPNGDMLLKSSWGSLNYKFEKSFYPGYSLLNECWRVGFECFQQINWL